MARYRKVDTRVWNDEKFRTLSHQAQLVFFYLLTCPSMTSLGAMRHTISGMAEELAMDPKAFREAFREALAKGMAKHDEKACCVWLPNFLKYNSPESPNVVRSWENWIDQIPECELKVQCLQGVILFVESLGKGFREALPEAFRKAIGSPPLIPFPNPSPNPTEEERKEKGFVPTLEEVLGEALTTGKPKDEAERFFHYNAGKGWQGVRDWRSALRGFKNLNGHATPPRAPAKKPPPTDDEFNSALARFNADKAAVAAERKRK